MFKIDLTKDFSFINKLKLSLDKLEKREIKKALKKSGQAMKDSVKAGYQQSKDPMGKTWPKLKYSHRPDDSGVAPLYNPRFKVTEASKPLINTGQMWNSISSAFIDNNTVIIGYGDAGRAAIALKHHLGLPGVYKYRYSNGGQVYSREMTPQKRRNIGFARNWVRLKEYGMNDVDIVLTFIREPIQEALKGKL